MGNFLDLFPRTQYRIAPKSGSFANYTTQIDLTFRFGIIKSALNNISAYYLYTIRDGDTPEILAEKVYNDPEAHWIILMANDIVDPQFDWPMDTTVFQKYLINKYGSVANAKTTIHHYDKVIRREESATGIVTEDRYQINYEPLTNSILELSNVQGDFANGSIVWIGNSISDYTFTGNVQSWSNTTGHLRLANTNGTYTLYSTITSNTANGIITDIVFPEVPYDTFLSLPETQSVETINFGNNKTVVETTFREAVTNYDWELAQNEKKREIKIIKAAYYRQIIEELDTLTKNARTPFLRTLR